jgi:predicted nucleic acid-binding protein
LKLFFDSSVLVPIFYADHPQHALSAKLFLGAGKDDFCALRTLGEVYATLTGLPPAPLYLHPLRRHLALSGTDFSLCSLPL